MVSISPAAPAKPILLSNRQFRRLWVGSAFSFLGIEVADIAYPLAILATTGSPGLAGAFGTVQLAATVVSGATLASLLDTLDRRRILLLAEATRAVVTAGVVIAFALGQASIAQLLIAAAILGAATPFSGAARMLLVREVVPPEQLTQALTQEEVRTSAAALAGPPLGGFLYGFGQAFPFSFTCLAFLLSWACALLVRVRPREKPAAPAAAGKNPMAGIRDLLADPTLRAATLLILILNAVGAPLALVAVVVLGEHGTSSVMIGIAMSGLAVGGLAGAALVGPLHRALQPGIILIALAIVEVPLLTALSVPFGPWWVAGVLFFAMLGIPALRVLVDVLIFRQVPDHQRGRVIAAVITLFSVGAPVGIAASGLLLQYFSARTTMLSLAGVLVVGALYCCAQPQLRRARWPVEASP
jgi:predicted MFS family arabinose efflux permease